MTKASVRLENNLQAVIQTRQHTWLADEPASDGGDDLGPMANEILLGALGACVAITARLYARRKGWPLEGVEVDLELGRYKKADYPAYTGDSEVVNDIKQRIVFHGPLTDEQKARLLEVAGRCPVHRILTQPIFISEELVEAETPPLAASDL